MPARARHTHPDKDQKTSKTGRTVETTENSIHPQSVQNLTSVRDASKSIPPLPQLSDVLCRSLADDHLLGPILNTSL